MVLSHISGQTPNFEFGTRNIKLAVFTVSLQESSRQRDAADHEGLQRVGGEAGGKHSSDQ